MTILVSMRAVRLSLCKSSDVRVVWIKYSIYFFTFLCSSMVMLDLTSCLNLFFMFFIGNDSLNQWCHTWIALYMDLTTLYCWLMLTNVKVGSGWGTPTELPLSGILLKSVKQVKSINSAWWSVSRKTTVNPPRLILVTHIVSASWGVTAEMLCQD